MHRRTALPLAILCTGIAFALPDPVAAVDLAFDVDAFKAGDESAVAQYNALLAKAKKAGGVPLIVGLSVPALPEGSRARPGDADQRRRRIAAVQDLLLADLAGVTTRGLKRFEEIPYLALTVEAAGFAKLARSSSVIAIEEDVLIPPTLHDSVPLIGGDRVHQSGYDGTGVTVAILDTGVDKTHPFLSGGKVVSEACYSSNHPTFSATSTCPGGVTESTASSSGAPCDASYAGCDHGTLVAGVAAGKNGTDGRGQVLQGMAPGASIIAIQVSSKFDNPLFCLPIRTGKCAKSFISDQMKGLMRVYALRHKYDIAAANLSLGGGRWTAECDGVSGYTAAINQLRAAGIATVIAAGNNGFTGATSSPACVSSAVTVGASDKQNGLWRSSNHATWVDVIAPGVSIRSSVPGDAYASRNGTSYAAPHVAGCFAIYRQRHPSASVTMFERAIESSATVFLTRGGISRPRLDCYRAVTAPLAATLVSPMGVTKGTTPTYSWNAVATANYHIRVRRGSDEVLRAWYTAKQVGCAAGAGICSITPSTVLRDGAHTWQIQTFNSHAVGPWSDTVDFRVGPPGATAITAPQGTTGDTTPTYSWNAVAAATAYYLEVDRGASRVIRTLYTARDAGCATGTGTCSITPTTVLQRGAHTWRIQTWNPRGMGLRSSSLDFTVGPPGAASPVSPQGTTGVTTPTYSWNAAPTADAYYLWVDRGSSRVIRTWYTAKQVGCAAGAGTCSITPTTVLQRGAHSWRIQTGSPQGVGPWSDSVDFTVGAGRGP